MAGLDAFKKAAVSKPSAKKSEKHTFTDNSLNSAIDQWVAANAAIKQAEQQKAEAEAEFLPKCEDERIKASTAAGSNETTVILNNKLAITQSKRYSNVDAATMPVLKQAFADDTERYFRTRMAVSVKPSILEDDTKLNELVAAIGAENIAKYFDVVENVVVTEAFHVERSTNPAVTQKAKNVIEAGIIKPYKAAVKLV